MMVQRANELLIDDIVSRIGSELRRSEKEINIECQKLRSHWVTTMRDWKMLSEERRNSLSLPVLLNSKIHSFISQNKDPETEIPISNILSHTKSTLSVVIGDQLYEFLMDEKIQTLCNTLGEATKLYNGSSEIPFSNDIPISRAIVPNNRIELPGGKMYKFASSTPLSALESWLLSLEMQQYINVFHSHDLDDFLTLPFIREVALEGMGIVDPHDKQVLIDAITNLCNLSQYEFVGCWLGHLGFPNLTPILEEKKIDLQVLLDLKQKEFYSMGFPSNRLNQLWNVIERYKKFSSVEETFRWLQMNGFEKYSFHFARYNIPFYAVPFVNFFIVNEMGVTIDDQNLLSALQRLKDSPTYNAKSVTFWLRDLELEKYNTIFAKNFFYALEHYTMLDEKVVDQLVLDPEDNEKMKTGIREMKEFQFYYTATSSLLQELGMEKYSKLFALHGISIDILPLLTESQLIEMGITNISDRKRILSVIKKIKDFFPYHDRQPIMREKSSKKQFNSKIVESNQNASSHQENGEHFPENRSVEEWLEFINDDVSTGVTKTSNPPSKKSAKRTNKKRRRKQAKRLAKQTGAGSTPSSPSLNPVPSPPAKAKSIDALEAEIHEQVQIVASSKQKTQPLENSGKSSKLVHSEPTSKSLDQTLVASSKFSEEDFLSSPLKHINTSSSVGYADGSFSISTGNDPLVEMFPVPSQEDSEDEIDPEVLAELNAEVEEFRRRLESATSKSKLTPVFYLPH